MINMKSIIKFSIKKYIQLGFFALATVMSGCSDNDTPAGGLYFTLDGVADNHVTIDATGNGLGSLDSGKVYEVRARGNWELRPVEGAEPEWARIYPLNGSDDGVIRVYMDLNSEVRRRQVDYNIYINGILQDYKLVIEQDPTQIQMTMSADQIRLKTSGGEGTIKVTSNVDWTLEYDESLDWLKVTRDGDYVNVSAPSENMSGATLNTTITVRAVEPYEDTTLEIKVMQLFALYSEDFSWIGDTERNPVCWNTTSEPRLDQWENKFKDAVEDMSLITGWTGMKMSEGKVLIFASHNYLKFGSTTRSANLCSPAVKSIVGEINATVSWSMAGFTTKQDVRVDGNEFYVGILGPGRIVDATAYGESSAWVDKTVKIPYSSTGEGDVYDVELTEVAGFKIGSDGYFSISDPTGLKVWNAPESSFSIKVEGMINATRIVFVSCEPEKVNGLNGKDWLNSYGSYSDNRKLFDNFMIEAE